MCSPHDLINEIRIQVDHHGQPLGATVLRHTQSDHESTQPLGVGPFDTPDEVWQRAKEALDVQLTLW